MPQLTLTPAGAVSVHAECRPTGIRHDGKESASLRYQCRTCLREYDSFSEFTFNHGPCACPSMKTWEK